MDKKTYIMFKTWSPMFLQMDDAELGKLMKDIFRYQDGEEVKSNSPIFALIKQAFDENSKKYEEQCRAKKRNAIKGVLKRSTPDARAVYIDGLALGDIRALMDMTADSPQIQTELAQRLKSVKGSNCQQVLPTADNCQHYEYDNESENDNDNENEYENDSGEKHPYGNQQNIYLTDNQYFGLVREYGTTIVKEAIDNVGYSKRIGRIQERNDYIAVSGHLRKENALCRAKG